VGICPSAEADIVEDVTGVLEQIVERRDRPKNGSAAQSKQSNTSTNNRTAIAAMASPSFQGERGRL
jgi:hypothetical protein